MFHGVMDDTASNNTVGFHLLGYRVLRPDCFIFVKLSGNLIGIVDVLAFIGNCSVYDCSYCYDPSQDDEGGR